MKIQKENLKFTAKLKPRHETLYIIRHHIAASHATIQDIHRWHLDRGWAGCGYHLYIRKNGKIYQGRPLHTVGAHTIGYNHTSIGIALEGDFRTEVLRPAQHRSLIALQTHLAQLYPTATFTDHRTFSRTSCPALSPIILADIDQQTQSALHDIRQTTTDHTALTRQITYLKARIQRMLSRGKR